MLLHHDLGTAVQIARPAVIPQAAPQTHHIVDAGLRQISHRGQMLRKSFKVVPHRHNLGLLQHDFRQPDAVGIDRVLPGQAVAPMAFLPAHHFFSDALGA